MTCQTCLAQFPTLVHKNASNFCGINTTLAMTIPELQQLKTKYKVMARIKKKINLVVQLEYKLLLDLEETMVQTHRQGRLLASDH